MNSFGDSVGTLFSINCFYRIFQHIFSLMVLVWWNTGRRLGVRSDIPESLVGAVASCAGLERQFSTLGLTYATLRTQLGVDKAGKLAFQYQQLNMHCFVIVSK